MKQEQLNELLLQSLEHEKGGVLVYQTALECAVNDDLREEWERYLGETQNHVRVLMDVFKAFGLDPEQQSAGRKIVHEMGASLVEAMRTAVSGGDMAAAQLVACESVVLAETKDHLNWHLLGMAAEKLTGERKKALQAAVEEVEEQEDEHLYHTKGWCRELWVESLGMKAVLPPPEERKEVKSAIGAARAESARAKMR
jgi:ferritin-like metal-binding protein YciE